MAVKHRKKVGVILNFSNKWMGGVIYILNAIKIFNWLDDGDKPKIVLFYKKSHKKFLNEINYPYLETIEWDFASPNKNYLKSWITGKDQFVEPLINHTKLDVIFPLQDCPIKNSSDVKLIHWYADLQHKYYPQFFSLKTRLMRDARLKLLTRNSQHLVVSSESVLKDFKRYFNINKSTQTHIFHFASVIDNFDFSIWERLLHKYELPTQYFMVSNQFHRHKNHKVVLEALSQLKKRGQKIIVAFTGKLPDDSSSEHYQVLNEIIKRNQLEDQVKFIGVLSRHEQLTLMKYAQAVIQPSLFEGWSTVIEDSISLQTPVIASNIEVNLEQLGKCGVFFDPHDPAQLATLLEEYPERKKFDEIIFEPYDKRMKRAAQTLMSIFNS